MSNILVTGSNGFIGGAMIDFLQCVGYDIYDPGYGVFEYDSGDGEPNIYDVIDIIENNDIDTVMHFGAITSTAETDVYKVIKYNYDFTKELMDYCCINDILLQFSSSASVYGNKNTTTPFKETDTPDPLTPYALSKYLCEQYAMERIMQDGARIQIFRYFNVWSNSLEAHKGSQASPFYTFYNDLSNGEKVKLFRHQGKEFVRDFVWYRDLVKIQHNFLKVEEDGIWNIGSGKAMSFEDVLKRIARYNSESLELMKWFGTEDPDKLHYYVDFPEYLRPAYQTYTQADMTKTTESLKRFRMDL